MPSSDNDLPRVAAVLLAAGESTRMHEMKALLPWVSGRPLLAYQAQTLRDAGFDPIVRVCQGSLPGVVPWLTRCLGWRHLAGGAFLGGGMMGSSVPPMGECG